MQVEKKGNINSKTILSIKKAMVSKSDLEKIHLLNELQANGTLDKILDISNKKEAKEIKDLVELLIYNSFTTNEFEKEINTIIIKNSYLFAVIEGSKTELFKRIKTHFDFHECVELVNKAAYYIVYSPKERLSKHKLLLNTIKKRAYDLRESVDIEEVESFKDLLETIAYENVKNAKEINTAFLEIKVKDAKRIKYFIDNYYNLLTEENKVIAQIIKDIK